MQTLIIAAISRGELVMVRAVSIVVGVEWVGGQGCKQCADGAWSGL